MRYPFPVFLKSALRAVLAVLNLDITVLNAEFIMQKLGSFVGKFQIVCFQMAFQSHIIFIDAPDMDMVNAAHAFHIFQRLDDFLCINAVRRRIH